MREHWDERYASPAYVYGTQPNRWLAGKLNGLPAGSILFPAEGEGRNAVYAARLGWNVYAFDQSSEGRKKALKLATEQRVCISYQLGDLANHLPSGGPFDVIALIFVHIHESQRRQIHRRLISLLKPDGYLIVEAFTKKQMYNNSGGPKSPAMLYDREAIRQDFSELDFIEFGEEVVTLNEGPFHRGDANVIRLFARKLKKH